MPIFPSPAGVAYRMRQFYLRYVLRDPFTLEMRRWVRDRGDETLRLCYPLDESSTVFDVGGYLGDFTQAIHGKFGCRVFLFEPVPSFHGRCLERFGGNPAIRCLDYALSAASGPLQISVDDDASSLKTAGGDLTVQVRSVVEAIADLGVERIDLMKINVEGSEFDLLPALIDSGLLARIRFLQVQFHRFVPDAAKKRSAIRAALLRTHRPMWNYEFVWESWENAPAAALPASSLPAGGGRGDGLPAAGGL